MKKCHCFGYSEKQRKNKILLLTVNMKNNMDFSGGLFRNAQESQICVTKLQFSCIILSLRILEGKPPPPPPHTHTLVILCKTDWNNATQDCTIAGYSGAHIVW